MNLVYLKYFEAVCIYGTTSAAAEHMHISQPSLSAAIKSLESEFGVKLFRRGHSGMTLTPEGETFYKLSRELLSVADRTEDIMHDLGSAQKTLRLGVPPMIGSIMLPKIFSEFSPQNADIRLEIIEAGRRELLSKLSDELTDMVFLPHNRPFEAALASILAARFEIVCCVGRSSPLAKKAFIAPADLVKIPLVLFEDSFFQTQEIKSRFSADGIKPNVLLQTSQLSTLSSLITNSVAVGCMFRELIADTPALCAIPFSDPMFVDISLVWKKDVHMKGSMKRLRDFVRSLTFFDV